MDRSPNLRLLVSRRRGLPRAPSVATLAYSTWSVDSTEVRVDSPSHALCACFADGTTGEGARDPVELNKIVASYMITVG